MTDALPLHSRVGASGMSRWERDHCPGSVRLSEGLENKAGFAGVEGTVAHELAELALNGNPYKNYVGEVASKDGFSVTISKEMIEFVTEYKVLVDDLCNENTARHVEHKFHLKDLHPALFGTADCVLWDPVRKHLDVIDFKYGAGHAVEAEDNVQLQYYAVGAVMTLGYAAESIDLHIIQPRCPHHLGPHRTAAMDALGLLDFAAYLVASFNETQKDTAAVRAGDWCRYCAAAGVPNKCPAQAKAANELAKVAFAPALPYKPAELQKWLDRLPVLEAQIKAVREFAYNEAEAGRTPPGYKLVEKQAREKWRHGLEAEELTDFTTLGGWDDHFEPRTMKSPAQMRKLVPGKNDKERAAALAPFTVKESSGHTLVHEGDKRIAVTLLTAQAVFAAP